MRLLFAEGEAGMQIWRHYPGQPAGPCYFKITPQTANTAQIVDCDEKGAAISEWNFGTVEPREIKCGRNAKITYNRLLLLTFSGNELTPARGRVECVWKNGKLTSGWPTLTRL